MNRKPWGKKIILKIFAGIGGMIFGALFMITGLLIFVIEVLFQGIEKIFVHLV